MICLAFFFVFNDAGKTGEWDRDNFFKSRFGNPGKKNSRVFPGFPGYKNAFAVQAVLKNEMIFSTSSCYHRDAGTIYRNKGAILISTPGIRFNDDQGK